jgi:hypothetical protein
MNLVDHHVLVLVLLVVLLVLVLLLVVVMVVVVVLIFVVVMVLLVWSRGRCCCTFRSADFSACRSSTRIRIKAGSYR